jgi:hypothetical protein
MLPCISREQHRIGLKKAEIVEKFGRLASRWHTIVVNFFPQGIKNPHTLKLTSVVHIQQIVEIAELATAAIGSKKLVWKLAIDLKFTTQHFRSLSIILLLVHHLEEAQRIG